MNTEDSSKEGANTGRLPPNAGNGRPKGSVNKITKALKEMILGALADAGGEGGGQAYLTKQAEENPVAFMTLLGKVLPTTLAGDPEAPLLSVRDEELEIKIGGYLAKMGIGQ